MTTDPTKINPEPPEPPDGWANAYRDMLETAWAYNTDPELMDTADRNQCTVGLTALAAEIRAGLAAGLITPTPEAKACTCKPAPTCPTHGQNGTVSPPLAEIDPAGMCWCTRASAPHASGSCIRRWPGRTR